MAIKVLGRWLYGALFVLLLPIGLAAWACGAAHYMRLAVPWSPPVGLTLAGAGAALALWGMFCLRIYGGGLPMNAYPPPRYVERGVYRWLPHPIYVGFVTLVAGVSITVGSASGLWLVCPLVALGCAALVLGYERHDMAKRFGRAPRCVLPEADDARPSMHDRLACYLFVLAPWAALYEAVVGLGPAPDAFPAQFAFEKRLPVVEWSELLYFSVYVLTLLAPLCAGTRRDLRAFCVRGLLAMAIAFPMYLLLPLAGPQRAFEPHTMPGRLLSWERGFDNAAGAFPSFHVIWALLAAEVFASRWPRTRWGWRGWAVLAAASCVSAGQHPIADVAGGFITVGLVARGQALWAAVRRTSERVANSWREWRIGPVRVINHGIYVGLGGTLAFWIAEILAGPEARAAILVAALAAVAGAALWAQYIEGSPQLLRPFGFYGGLLGGTLGALAAPFLGATVWLVLASFSASGPWAQAVGRLRCLVQGCCHGRPASQSIGIRYCHPWSRVCRMTEWEGVPLHATPVYSLLWNVLVGLVIARLWLLGAPLHLIVGLYFILNGLGRFVEEAWRGEPQTPVVARLRLYQWAAILSVVAGALMAALGASGPAPAVHIDWQAPLAAAGFGLLVCCAMGVDFPASKRRFSRLA